LDTWNIILVNEELVEEKIKEFIESDEFEEERAKLHRNIKEENENQHKSVIAGREEEIIEYWNKGYSCEKIDEGKWLMKKEKLRDLARLLWISRAVRLKLEEPLQLRSRSEPHALFPRGEQLIELIMALASFSCRAGRPWSRKRGRVTT